MPSVVTKKVKPAPYKGPLKTPPVTSAGGVEVFNAVAQMVLEEYAEVIKPLAPAEQAFVIRWLSDALVTGPDNALSNTLWDKDYIRRPVDVDTFFKDPYYLGRHCSELDETWMADLRDVLAPDSTISEWISTGSIGAGKTTVAMAAMAYKLYQMSCLRNPSAYYGLLPGSKIVFGVYSITKNQVTDSGYGLLRDYIDDSPYFQNEFPRNKRIDSKLEFEKQNMAVLCGSREFHSIGLNVFAMAMDEANFMQAAKDKELGKQIGQAYSLYNALSSRIKSRFMRPGGNVPGLMVLMSSRRSQTDFLEERLKKATTSKDATGKKKGKVSDQVYVSDYALWEIKPHRYPMPTFRVEVGDRLRPSRIVLPNTEVIPGRQYVDVPGDFRRQFEEDVERALRDIAGVATFNLSPLIRDRQSVFDAVREDRLHPFSQEFISISTEDEARIEDSFDIRAMCHVRNGKWVAKLNPTAHRYIHVDIALTNDSAGIAVGHFGGTKRSRHHLPDGTFVETFKPYINFDLLLAIRPPVNGEIDLSKIRSFVLYLRQIFPLRGVTFDGYQSRDSCQMLRKSHVAAHELSVDRTDKPYLGLRSALSDRRVTYYSYPKLIEELLYLERDVSRGKVDHPQKFPNGDKGSKDVSDCVCGVVEQIMVDEFASNYGGKYVDETPYDPMAESAAESAAASSNGDDTVSHSEVLKTASQSNGERVKVNGLGPVDWKNLAGRV